jgi:hypothetical protein
MDDDDVCVTDPQVVGDAFLNSVRHQMNSGRVTQYVVRPNS